MLVRICTLHDHFRLSVKHCLPLLYVLVFCFLCDIMFDMIKFERSIAVKKRLKKEDFTVVIRPVKKSKTKEPNKNEKTEKPEKTRERE